MTVRFYMDEQVPRQITLGLRLRNIDVLTVQEDDRAGLDDPNVLARAIALQRVLFTRDDDFFAIVNTYLEAGKAFSGIVYSHQQLASIGDCVRDLEFIANACEMKDFVNHVEFLPL
jgi:predicted nuclease of predicted toxin-antitoxin system